jgi:transposase InsO family protein
LWNYKRITEEAILHFLLGKRKRRTILTLTASAATNQPQGNTEIHLDYMLFNASEDPRPHITVNIFGIDILGLLDSGSSRTILGRAGWNKLHHLGLAFENRTVPNITVADGRNCTTEGEVTVPISLQGKVGVFQVLVVPEICPELVLGMDFWTKMKLVPDFSSGTWEFSYSPIRVDTVNTEPIVRSRDNLTPEERKRLDRTVQKHFTKMGNKLGRTHLVEHVIDTGTAKPIKQRYYPVSPKVQEIFNEELDKLLEAGVVEPSSSGWSSPAWIVKRNGKRRFIVDLRAVNAVTVPDAYPLPYINQALDRLRDARYVSTIDVKSAFFQVPLAKESRPKTAFTVPGRGLFQFTCTPQGARNSPATWQRLMDATLRPDLDPYLFVYLDDIIVVTQTFEQHLKVVNSVLKRLHEAKLTVNQEKSEFCRPELKYLGYVIDARGLRVDPDKVIAILNVPVPKNLKDVRKFLGVTSWYRRFIPDFSTKTEALTSMQRKGKEFVWTEEADRAFTTLKECLVQAPILSCPDFAVPFQVQTDASGYGLGAVIYQLFGREERVIAFASRSLTNSERKFTATERECLAVLWAVEKWRPYLEGYHFTVHTDHSCLLWLHKLKDPQGRLGRWVLRLQQYDYDVIHRKGKENVVADYLSRTPYEPCSLIQITQPIRDQWYLKMKGLVTEKPQAYPSWRVENGTLMKYVEDNRKLTDTEAEWKIVVPKDDRTAVCHESHDPPTAGHLGILKTIRRAAVRHYWPKMNLFISNYVRHCKTCQQAKTEQTKPTGLMGQSRDSDRPWRRISTDLIGPLPRSTKGNKYILVVSDTFTKFTLTFPIRSATSAQVCSRMEEVIFLSYGVPEVIVCDNGSEFISTKFKALAKKYDVKLHYTAKRHPQANPVERTNKTIVTMLRSYVEENHKKWDTHLPEIACALRTAVSEVTGFSPYYLNFGREMILRGTDHRDRATQTPLEDDVDRIKELERIFADVKARLARAHEANATRYNLRRRPQEFHVDDQVWKRNFQLSDAAADISAKLSPKYTGPYTITSKISPTVYKLIDSNGRDIGRWHVSDLKEYV